MKFFVQRDIRFAGSEIVIIDEKAGKPVEVVFSVKNNHEEGSYYQPSMGLTDAEAQNLLQELWRAGYRPNNGESTIAHVEALKYHLEDMRKLAFKKK